jgi:peptidoglycan/xylan/chitin deacetylase (PgdA/CDA1 family)
MKWLRLAGYHPVTPDAWLEYRERGTKLPSSPVILSFDDGFQDCFAYAVPVLQEHKFPAIFFIVAGLVGKSSVWIARERGVDLPLMDWNALRQLRAGGFECGSHTLTHPHLAELPAELCHEELYGSRRLLEDRLCCRIRHLAYPFGSYSNTVRDFAHSAGYALAFTTQIGLSSISEDPLTLRRVPVSGEESLLDFACRLLSGWNVRDLLRRSMLRARHRLAPRATDRNP